jgi:DNA-binding LytR/AlgR family response regulator
MKLRIAICDDIESHRNSIKEITENILNAYLGDEFYSKPVVEYSEFSDVESVLKSITEDNREYNLLLTDIQMPENEADGIDLAKTINKLLPECRIIFVTGYPDYSMDVYETNHIYLVLKSRLREGLEGALRKAINSIFNDTKNKIAFNCAGGNVVVKASEIIYLERIGRNTKIITDDSSLESKQNFNEIEPLLPEAKFVKCHNGFIVNLDKVKVYRTSSVVTESGDEIPISKKFKDKFNDSFFMNIIAKSTNEVS